MFITVDPYNDIARFNEIKEALKNNNVKYDLFINIKPPFNWYFELDQYPIMVNYDELRTEQNRFLINTVKPATPSDAYLLIRRNNDTAKSGLLRYTENQALKEARLSKYAVFFTVGSKDSLLNISSEYPGKIWFLGKYYSNKYRVCLCTHPAIKLLLNPEQILLEKNNVTEIGAFEAEFNYKVLRLRDYLRKFTQTPFAENGKYIHPKIILDSSGKYFI